MAGVFADDEPITSDDALWVYVERRTPDGVQPVVIGREQGIRCDPGWRVYLDEPLRDVRRFVEAQAEMSGCALTFTPGFLWLEEHQAAVSV